MSADLTLASQKRGHDGLPYVSYHHWRAVQSYLTLMNTHVIHISQTGTYRNIHSESTVVSRVTYNDHTPSSLGTHATPSPTKYPAYPSALPFFSLNDNRVLPTICSNLLVQEFPDQPLCIVNASDSTNPQADFRPPFLSLHWVGRVFTSTVGRLPVAGRLKFWLSRTKSGKKAPLRR